MLTAEDYERQERERCARKQRWSRREAAARYLAGPEAQGYICHPVFVYHCRWCFGWHLTSAPQIERPA